MNDAAVAASDLQYDHYVRRPESAHIPNQLHTKVEWFNQVCYCGFVPQGEGEPFVLVGVTRHIHAPHGTRYEVPDLDFLKSLREDKNYLKGMPNSRLPKDNDELRTIVDGLIKVMNKIFSQGG